MGTGARFERRVTMCLVLAAVSFALLPLADQKFRSVCVVLGTTYVVLALGFLIDWLSRSRSHRGQGAGDDVS